MSVTKMIDSVTNIPKLSSTEFADLRRSKRTQPVANGLVFPVSHPSDFYTSIFIIHTTWCLKYDASQRLGFVGYLWLLLNDCSRKTGNHKIKPDLYPVMEEPFWTVSYRFLGRPSHNVDVLAVQDFRISFYRPKTPGFYSRYLLTKHKGHGRKRRRTRRL